MELISRDELKEKMDRGDDFKLVFVLGDWHFRAQHIPGSLNIQTPEQAQESLDKDDEIVVYCSNKDCPASVLAYRILKDLGYQNVRRFAGGLFEWVAAGYPVEGEMGAP